MVQRLQPVTLPSRFLEQCPTSYFYVSNTSILTQHYRSKCGASNGECLPNTRHRLYLPCRHYSCFVQCAECFVVSEQSKEFHTYRSQSETSLLPQYLQLPDYNQLILLLLCRVARKGSLDILSERFRWPGSQQQMGTLGSVQVNGRIWLHLQRGQQLSNHGNKCITQLSCFY